MKINLSIHEFLALVTIKSVEVTGTNIFLPCGKPVSFTGKGSINSLNFSILQNLFRKNLIEYQYMGTDCADNDLYKLLISRKGSCAIHEYQKNQRIQNVLKREPFSSIAKEIENIVQNTIANAAVKVMQDCVKKFKKNDR